MPTPRWYLDGAVVNNSLGQPVFFAVGGSSPSGRYVRTVEAYNFATNTWSGRRDLPLPLAHMNGIGVIGGKLYMSGGAWQLADFSTGYHPGLNVYDPVQNTWTKKADMPKRISNGVTGVINGKLYVLSGYCHDCGPDKWSARLYRYDPVTNIWTALAWAPNRHSSGAGAVINGKFYVAGGYDNFEHSNKLDVFDPAAGRWRTLAPMPTARGGASGAVLQNKFYVIGKGGDDPRVQTNQVEAYDPVTNTWSTKTQMLGDGQGDFAAGSLTFGGRPYILVVGGYNDARTNEAYTP
jgi:N-acetylneuraminic acid mutarotase